ncbi:MAG TPA: fibronectin type III domain-containing protein [Firmicutes bacterium]|nr:fibronectin type III domain-containing protein [Bacillota bacterium]
MHATLKVCSQSGLLPSEYCPEHLLEEKVFLNRPEYLTTTKAWPGGANRKPADAEQMPPTEVCDIHTSRPNPPGNLSYKINDEMTAVTLNWDAVKEAAGYLVFKKKAGEEAFTLLTETPLTGRSYTDKKIMEKEKYVYQVVAVSASGVYAEAVSITVEVPEKPVIYSLTVAAEGPDGGNIEPAAGSYSFKAGTQVHLKAKDVPGWNFIHWLIEGETQTTDTRKNINVTLSSNLKVTAVYEKVNGEEENGEGNGS